MQTIYQLLIFMVKQSLRFDNYSVNCYLEHNSPLFLHHREEKDGVKYCPSFHQPAWPRTFPLPINEGLNDPILYWLTLNSNPWSPTLPPFLETLTSRQVSLKSVHLSGNFFFIFGLDWFALMRYEMMGRFKISFWKVTFSDQILVSLFKSTFFSLFKA